MGEHLLKHGDGVKDIAFEVENVDGIVKVMSHLAFIQIDIERAQNFQSCRCSQTQSGVNVSI